MSLISKIFIAGYILTHLSVAFLGVRVWPFTDYPMFGRSYEKFDQIRDIKLKAFYLDGSASWLPRNFVFSYGSFKANVPRAYQDDSKLKMKKLLEEVIRYRGGSYLNITRIEIYEKSITRKMESHEFEITDKVLYSITL